MSATTLSAASPAARPNVAQRALRSGAARWISPLAIVVAVAARERERAPLAQDPRGAQRHPRDRLGPDRLAATSRTRWSSRCGAPRSGLLLGVAAAVALGATAGLSKRRRRARRPADADDPHAAAVRPRAAVHPLVRDRRDVEDRARRARRRDPALPQPGGGAARDRPRALRGRRHASSSRAPSGSATSSFPGALPGALVGLPPVAGRRVAGARRGRAGQHRAPASATSSTTPGTSCRPT